MINNQRLSNAVAFLSADKRLGRSSLCDQYARARRGDNTPAGTGRVAVIIHGGNRSAAPFSNGWKPGRLLR